MFQALLNAGWILSLIVRERVGCLNPGEVGGEPAAIAEQRRKGAVLPLPCGNIGLGVKHLLHRGIYCLAPGSAQFSPENISEAT